MSTSKEKASIAIYGAGAIGGHLGAMLSKAGFEVSLIARGDHPVSYTHLTLPTTPYV